MNPRFSRPIPMLGEEGFNKLRSKHVAVFGVGGVGGIVAEALARSGVGKLTFIDGDVFEESNINRQIGALASTLGRPKAEVFKERVLDINPDIEAEAINIFYDGNLDLTPFDYVADCIDSVNEKTKLIVSALRAGIPVLSGMGAGNKRDSSRFKVADIYSTKVCPLARVMRNRLRKEGVKSLRVVYSDELPEENAKVASFMPATAAAGLKMAETILSDLLAEEA